MNLRNLRREDELEDVQAGSRGLGVAEAARRYTKPGQVLVAIRTIKGQDLTATARGAGIQPDKLRQYESGESAPTLPELVALAKFLGADLRRVLEAFGHVKEDAAEESMGIAAKFDGQLDANEKSDLREIVRAAAGNKKLR